MPYIKLTAPMIVREVEGPHGDRYWDTELAIKTEAVKAYLEALVTAARITETTADTILSLNKEADICAFGSVVVIDETAMPSESFGSELMRDPCIAEVDQESGSITVMLRKTLEEEMVVLQELFPYPDIVSCCNYGDEKAYIARTLSKVDERTPHECCKILHLATGIWILQKKDITESDFQAVVLAFYYRDSSLQVPSDEDSIIRDIVDTYIVAADDIKRALGLCKQIHERGEPRAQAFSAALIAGYIDMDALEAFLNTSTEGPYWEFAGDVKRYVSDHLPAAYRLD